MNQRKSLPKSTAVLVLGICSILFGGLVLGIFGIVLSGKGRKMYTQNPNLYKGYGNLHTGYVMSIIGTIWSVLLILGLIIFGRGFLLHMFEMFQLPFMVQAFAAAVITGILLSYLGVHVVGRGIVFVDLALGQISSLGVAFATFIGTGLTSIPLIFTLSGALLMSFINIRDKRLKQEAIIGILYAFASALTVLLISKTAHGDSDIQEVLFGNILSVSWQQITSIGIVSGAILLVQLIFFRKFFALTESFENGVNHLIGIFNIWNFLFYISIGLAIVYAVRINGVIPVFSYLIIPAVSAIMLSKNKTAVLMIAMLISILAGFFGLNFSFHYDFPAGSSIVVVLGAIFMLAAVYRVIRGITYKKQTSTIQ